MERFPAAMPSADSSRWESSGHGPALWVWRLLEFEEHLGGKSEVALFDQVRDGAGQALGASAVPLEIGLRYPGRSSIVRTPAALMSRPDAATASTGPGDVAVGERRRGENGVVGAVGVDERRFRLRAGAHLQHVIEERGFL